MKVLVVGGAGYIGGAVTDILMKERNHEVKVYDNLLYEDRYMKGIDFVYGDIRDHERLKPLLAWADAVVWLAAFVGDGACAINPELSKELNQDSVEWLSQNYNGRIVFLSTCSVYGAQDGILDELSPTNPLSVYAVTKLAAEQYLKNKNAIIFRLGTIFGISDQFSRIRLDLVVNTMTVRAFTFGSLKVFGGEQYRPLLHVRDAGRTIVENLETSYTGIYNLHYWNAKIADLAEEVRYHFPKIYFETVEMKFEDLRNYRVKGDKAQKVLGFAPSLTVSDGVMELKKMLEEHRIKDLDNPLYTNQKYLSLFDHYTQIREVSELAETEKAALSILSSQGVHHKK